MALFVWDFHGVLEKDNDLAVCAISNKALELNGYGERFTNEDCFRLTGLRWWEYYKALLPNEAQERWMKLQDDSVNYQIEHQEVVACYIKPNDHALEVVERIARAGHEQILISKTNPASLSMFVHAVRLHPFFPEGKYIGVNTHDQEIARTKLQALQDYVGDRNYDSLIAIGDSPDDVALAEPYGGVSYLYAHPGRKHREAQATYRINDLREVLREI